MFIWQDTQDRFFEAPAEPVDVEAWAAKRGTDGTGGRRGLGIGGVIVLDTHVWIWWVSGSASLRFVPVDNRIAIRSTRLQGSFHADPADRIIVATARSLGATLVTKDQKLRRYRHVETLW